MKVFSLLFLSVIFFCNSFANTKKNEHFIIECKILSNEGKVLRNFGASMCAYLPDGSLISGAKNKLSFYGPDMRKKWEKKLSIHHQLKLSNDSKQILVMDYSIHEIKKEKIRFDKFVILDLEGNAVKELDFFNYQTELLKLALVDRRRKAPIDNSEAKFEFSHANSFYEIAENALEKKHSAFKKGNYIININLLGLVIIMDANLKNILWSMPQYTKAQIRKSVGPSWHDVSLLKSGSLLVFNNYSYMEKGKVRSTIDEVDPLSGKKKILYPLTKPSDFYSEYAGGVEILEESTLLLNTVTPHGRAFKIDLKTGNTLWSMDYPFMDELTGRPDVFQQIKSQDLSLFLEKNKGF